MVGIQQADAAPAQHQMLIAPARFRQGAAQQSGKPLNRHAARCVHHLEMSLIVPFRNVTVAGFGWRAGAKPVRNAAPARRPPSAP